MLEPPRALASSSLLDLKTLWSDLISGRSLLLGNLYWEDRCFVTIEQHAAPHFDRRLRERRVDVLTQVLLGRSQKELAYDLDLAVSTVALTCSDALRAMSNNHLVSRAPGVLFMAAHAASGFAQPPAFVYPTDTDAGRYFVLSVGRLDQNLPGALSAAETAVIRLQVEGHSHAQIARARDTSVRTVANQLAAAFRKLRSSGRSELLAALARRASTVPVSPMAAAPPPPPTAFTLVQTSLAVEARGR